MNFVFNHLKNFVFSCLLKIILHNFSSLQELYKKTFTSCSYNLCLIYKWSFINFSSERLECFLWFNELSPSAAVVFFLLYPFYLLFFAKDGWEKSTTLGFVGYDAFGYFDLLIFARFCSIFSIFSIAFWNVYIYFSLWILSDFYWCILIWASIYARERLFYLWVWLFSKVNLLPTPIALYFCFSRFFSITKLRLRLSLSNFCVREC